MKIETQIELKDFIRFTFKLLYSKRLYQLLFIIGIFVFTASIFQFFMENTFVDPPYAEFFVGIFLIFIYPIIIFYKAKKNFESNKILQEKVSYEFIEDKILISGDSFNSELSWGSIIKVEETKDWILIYHNKQTAILLLKSSIGENLVPLKALISSKNVKTKFNKK